MTIPALYPGQTIPPLMADVARPDLFYAGVPHVPDAPTVPTATTSANGSDDPAGPKPSRTPLPPALADDYRVDEELDAGGMARVWRGARLSDDGTVVLREARAIGLAGYLTLERLRELEHPNLVRQERALHTDDGRYLWQVLEYCPRGSLADTPRQDVDLHRLIADVGDALRYLHEKGIAHTDVKPRNVLVRDEGAFALADLDTCITVDDPGKPSPERSGHNTPGYTPPDVEYGTPFDWFQLGLTVLHVLTDFRRPGDNLRLVDFAAFDARVVLLLSGLLDEQPDSRWAHGEVHEWLAGKNPPARVDLRDQRVDTNGISVRYASAVFHDPAELADRMSKDWTAAHRALLTRVDTQPWLTDVALQLDDAGDSSRATELRHIQDRLGENPSKALLDDAVAQVIVLLNPGGTPRFSPDAKNPVQLDDVGLRILARDIDAAVESPGSDERSIGIADMLIDTDLLHTFSRMTDHEFLWAIPDECRRALTEYDRQILATLRAKQGAVGRHERRIEHAAPGVRETYRAVVASRPLEAWEAYAVSLTEEAARLSEEDRQVAERHRRLTRARVFAYIVSPEQSDRLEAEARRAAVSAGAQQHWYRDLLETARLTPGPSGADQ
jgi:serine/threonine protein kinase